MTTTGDTTTKRRVSWFVFADVDSRRIWRVHNNEEGGSDEEQEGRNDEEEEGREMT